MSSGLSGHAPVTSDHARVQTEIASTTEYSNGRAVYRRLAFCAGMLVLGYALLFGLLQAPPLWYNLRPDPMRSLFPDVFRPINDLFSNRWVNLQRTDPYVLVMVPLYTLMLALITGPLVYLLRYFSRGASLTPRRVRRVLWAVFGVAALVLFVLLFSRGLLSSDIYSYEWYTRTWVP